MSKSDNRRRNSGEKGGQELVTAQGMPPSQCAPLPGPMSCGPVTLLFLHIQELEDEGLLLTEPARCFGNPGQDASGLLGNTWETCLQE